MKRTMIMACLGAVGCMLLVRAGGAAADDDDDSGNAVLAVHVVYGGKGLAGAAVKLAPVGGVEATDGRGYAAFKGLSAGRYTITVSARCHDTTETVQIDDLKTNTATVEVEDHCPAGDPDVTE